eukprot:105883_1
MGNSSTVNYIAFVGAKGSGKSSIIKQFKDLNNANEKLKANIDFDGVLFKHKKMNFYAYEINEEPSQWKEILEQKIKEDALDAVALVMDSNDFKIDSQVNYTLNRQHFDLILKYWEINTLPSSILDIIYSQMTQIYNVRHLYKTFVVENYTLPDQEFPDIDCFKTLSEDDYDLLPLTRFPLGVYANKHDTKTAMSLNDITNENLLFQLRGVDWYIAGSEALEKDGIYDAFGIIDWMSKHLKKKKKIKSPFEHILLM